MFITTFKSVERAYVEDMVDDTWEQIVGLLTEHRIGQSKADIPLYNLVQFKTLADPTTQAGRRYHRVVVDGVSMRDPAGGYDEIANTIRRCKDNVISIWAIVLDIDENLTIEQAITMLGDLEYVLYTTFRHTTERHKFRVVLPFSQALRAEDIAGRRASIEQTFPEVDAASFTVSQSFYFHSGHNDCIAYHNKGLMLDPYRDFAFQAPVTYTPATPVYSNTAMTPEQADAYRQAVVRSLRTCSGLHYAGKTTGADGVLTLVSICRSVGLNYDEFDDICSQIADPDSQLVSRTIRTTAWTGWSGDKIRADRRNKFISDYGGEPVKINKLTSLELELKKKYNI